MPIPTGALLEKLIREHTGDPVPDNLTNPIPLTPNNDIPQSWMHPKMGAWRQTGPGSYQSMIPYLPPMVQQVPPSLLTQILWSLMNPSNRVGK